MTTTTITRTTTLSDALQGMCPHGRTWRTAYEHCCLDRMLALLDEVRDDRAADKNATR